MYFYTYKRKSVLNFARNFVILFSLIFFAWSWVLAQTAFSQKFPEGIFGLKEPKKAQKVPFMIYYSRVYVMGGSSHLQHKFLSMICKCLLIMWKRFLCRIKQDHEECASCKHTAPLIGINNCWYHMISYLDHINTTLNSSSRESLAPPIISS